MNFPNPSKFGLKEKMIFVNSILISVIGVLVYFLVLPSITDIKKINSEIEAQLYDLENKYQRGQSLKKLNQNLKKIEPQIDTLSHAFVKQGQEVNFITALESLAASTSVNQKLNLGAYKKTSAGFSKAPLQIIASGNFKNIMDYFHQLEIMNYYIQIKNIEISQSIDNSLMAGQNQSIVTMNLDVDTYWQ